MLLDTLANNRARGIERGDGGRFVLGHEPRIPSHVGGEYRRQFSCLGFLGHPITEYWVSTSLSYPLHLVSEAAMTAD